MHQTEYSTKTVPVTSTLNLQPHTLEQGEGSLSCLSNKALNLPVPTAAGVQKFHLLVTIAVLVVVGVLSNSGWGTVLDAACATCVCPEFPPNTSSLSSTSGPQSPLPPLDLTRYGIEPNPGPVIEEIKENEGRGRSRSKRGKKTSTAMVLYHPPRAQPKKSRALRHPQGAMVPVLANAPPITRSSQSFLSGHRFNPRGDMASYAKTLMDAERYPPVRLGGETMIQTGLTTLHQVFQITTGSTASSCVLHPRAWSPLLISTTASAPYTFVSGGSWNTANILTFQTLAASARIVSAKLKLYTTAAATSDNGTLVGGLCPRDDGFFSPGSPGSLSNTVIPGANVSNIPDVSSGGYPIVPTVTATWGGAMATQGANELSSEDWSSTVPMKDGMSIFWLPQDPQSMIFTSDRVRQNQVAVVGSSTLTNAINGSPIQDPFFVFSLSGTTSGTVINAEIFLNFEYTVTAGASSIVGTQAGSMSSVQSFSVVKQIGGNLQNLTVPNPEASLADKAINLGKSILKGSVDRVSNFIFGSSDVGKAVSSFFD